MTEQPNPPVLDEPPSELLPPKKASSWPRRTAEWAVSNSESLNNIASTIQNVVVCLAIVAGGAWTWFEFGGLRKAELAQAELAAARSMQPVLNVSLEVSSRVVEQEGPPGRRIVLHVVATIENKGAVNTILRSDDWTLLVRPVHIQANPTSSALSTTGDTQRVDTKSARNLTLSRAGSVNRLEFLTEVRSPGLYEVSFALGMEGREFERLRSEPEFRTFFREFGESTSREVVRSKAAAEAWRKYSDDLERADAAGATDAELGAIPKPPDDEPTGTKLLAKSLMDVMTWGAQTYHFVPGR